MVRERIPALQPDESRKATDEEVALYRKEYSLDSSFPDPHPCYRMDPFVNENWDGMPRYGTDGLSGLLSMVHFVKAPKKGIREVMEKALQFCLEEKWTEYNVEKSLDRSKAPVVILRGQDNLAYASVDFGVENKHVVKLEVFDPAESVPKGMTKNVLDSNKSKSVYIVGRIQGPNDLDNLIKTCWRLRELGYKELTLITSYLAWTRQDRPDEKQGQPNATAAIMQVIAGLVDRLAVLKPHSNETGRNALINEIPFVAFSAWKYLVNNLLEERGDDIFTEEQKVVVVGPDAGAWGEAFLVAEYLSKVLSEKHQQNIKIQVVSLDKTRNASTGKIEFLPLSQEKRKILEDAVVVTVDDVIATARTSEKLKDLVLGFSQGTNQMIDDGVNGAKGVIFLSTHASFQGEAIRRLSEDGFIEVLFTDSKKPSVDPPSDARFRVISCMPLITKFVRADRDKNFNPWKKNSDFHDIVC